MHIYTHHHTTSTIAVIAYFPEVGNVLVFCVILAGGRGAAGCWACLFCRSSSSVSRDQPGGAGVSHPESRCRGRGGPTANHCASRDCEPTARRNDPACVSNPPTATTLQRTPPPHPLPPPQWPPAQPPPSSSPSPQQKNPPIRAPTPAPPPPSVDRPEARSMASPPSTNPSR